MEILCMKENTFFSGLFTVCLMYSIDLEKSDRKMK